MPSSALVSRVCSALDALYPCRTRGNHRLHPLEVVNQVVRVARSQGLRLGWKKFFRYVCSYPADARVWSGSERSLVRGLQHATLRGRNFARYRLNCDTFSRNACLHMVKNCKEIPYKQLPKQLRHYQCPEAMPPQVKILYQHLHRRKTRPGVLPRPQILRWKTFSGPSESGRIWLKFPSRKPAKSYLDYRYDTEKCLRRVTTRDLMGLKRRPKGPHSFAIAKMLSGRSGKPKGLDEYAETEYSCRSDYALHSFVDSTDTDSVY